MANSPPSLGAKVCEIGTGQPCDGLFQFRKEFKEIGQTAAPKVGESIVLGLSDPFSILTDVRRVVMLLNNDPARVFVVANQQEGSAASYDGKSSAIGGVVHVWIDADDVTAEKLQTLRTADARETVIDDSVSTPERIANKLGEVAEAERIRQRNMLIGGALFVLALVAMAAYVLPRIKIPALKVM